jgi:acyl-CoA dehydrogenase
MTEAKPMDLGITKHLQPILEAVRDMVRNEIMPLDEEFLAEVGAKGDRWSYTPRQTEILEGLKAKAKERGLWNLWRTQSDRGLTTVEYAYLAEEMGKAHLGAETFNCSAPDTGNMEVFDRYSTAEHKKQWLEPLLNGEIRSAYLMTEPNVASSDATNVSMACAPRWRRLRAQRREMVGVGRRRSALQDLHRHGAHRRRRYPEARPPFDDPRACRYGRHREAAADAGLRSG